MTEAHDPHMGADMGSTGSEVENHARGLSVFHTVSWLTPDKGGPAYTVPALAGALRVLGHKSRVFSLGPQCDTDAPWGTDIRRPNDLDDWGFLAKLGMSGSMRRDLVSMAAGLNTSGADATRADIIHAHGIWMLPCVYAADAAAAAGVPLVISPRGMLCPVRLRISSRKKRLFHQCAQRQAMRYASCFHATAESERDHIRAFGIKVPIAIIPNGIHTPEPIHESERPNEHKTVLSLGRIHPIKGLDRLIGAWAQIEDEFPDWQLKIVGPDEGDHARALTSLARKLGTRRVRIAPPVYGADKHKLYTECDLFVLATLSENFAVTVAEALIYNVPVISTKGAPWQGLDVNGCGWWIDHGREPLIAALRTAMSLPDSERKRMGARGRDWVTRDFSWSAVSESMAQVYAWLAGRGERPDCVDVAD